MLRAALLYKYGFRADYSVYACVTSIKVRREGGMPHANLHGCMPDVLSFVTEMVVFYDKYHLLMPEARVKFREDMNSLHRRMSRTCVVAEADVGSLSRRLQAMHLDFKKWMEDPMHENKEWNLHPSDEFKLLISKSKVILARMEHEILTHRFAR